MLQVSEEPAPHKAEPGVPAMTQQEPAQHSAEEDESAHPAATGQATEMEEDEPPAAVGAVPEEAPSHPVQVGPDTEAPLHLQVQEQSEEPAQPSPAELSADPQPAAAEAEEGIQVSTRDDYEPALVPACNIDLDLMRACEQ